MNGKVKVIPTCMMRSRLFGDSYLHDEVKVIPTCMVRSSLFGDSYLHGEVKVIPICMARSRSFPPAWPGQGYSYLHGKVKVIPTCMARSWSFVPAWRGHSYLHGSHSYLHGKVKVIPTCMARSMRGWGTFWFASSRFLTSAPANSRSFSVTSVNANPFSPGDIYTHTGRHCIAPLMAIVHIICLS